MATFTFGTLVEPAHYAEVQDTDYVDPDPPLDDDGVPQPRTLWVRPAAGAHLKVKNFVGLVDLPDIVTLLGGYWVYTTTDIPQIVISGDGGTTWIGPLQAVEAMSAAATAGVDSAAALTAASAAVSTANQALSTANAALAAVAGGGGGGGFTGTVTWDQVTGKPSIPSTAADVGAIPLAQKGASGGVATLGDGTGGTFVGKVPLGQILITTDATGVASGGHSHSWTWANMPAGSVGVIFYDTVSNSWPQRPTTRTDVMFIWVHTSPTTPAPVGSGYAIDGVDEFELRPAA